MIDLITKNKKIFVDIVIPVLNEERTIEQCLKSVLCFQKDDNVKVQIFIVDGGSSDKTLDIIKANFLNDSSIKILHNSKKYNLAQ
jgi:glycosyltransferase involved in cell wall biosynthesis